MLIGRGVTAWRRVLTRLTPSGVAAAGRGEDPGPDRRVGEPPALPAALTTELIDALAAVALAGTGPDRPPP